MNASNVIPAPPWQNRGLAEMNVLLPCATRKRPVRARWHFLAAHSLGAVEQDISNAAEALL
jgi:hypothetical protein